MTPDAARYLLLGWNLISGAGYTSLDIPWTRGPVFPGLLGGLMLIFERDVESLAWAVRLLALANPVLMYFLTKRVAGPMAGLLAAATVTLFVYTNTLWHAFNIDTFRLTVYLLAVLVLLIAAQRNSAGLSLLSGLLLGAAILTKETSVAILPLALLTALLLGWRSRGVLLHYVCVLVVCLPWYWIVYLQGSWSGLVILVTAALVSIALFVVVSYRFDIFARLLANERRQRRISWFVVLVGVIGFSVLISAEGISRYLYLDSEETLLRYIGRISQDISLWYLLPLAGVYVLWETVRGSRLWGFYLALLVLQIPVIFVAAMERLEVRNWLIVQALLYGALAGLVVKILGTLIRDPRLNLRWSLAFGAASVLIVVLVWGAVSQVQYLRSDDVNLMDANSKNLNVQNHYINENNPAVQDMHNWIADNVPEGEEIIVTPGYSHQLAFLDGMQHGWTPLQVDCSTGPNFYLAPGACSPSKETAQAPPQPAVWFKMNESCEGYALSLATLMQQMDRSGATYLLTTQEHSSSEDPPDNLAWAPYLDSSGAFETVYSSYLPGAPAREQSYGLVLLKQTGRDPTPAPTQMDARTAGHLISCEQRVWGERYAERIRSTFPNGIEVIGSQPEVESTRPAIEQIYRTG